jgi:hypothetical protein
VEYDELINDYRASGDITAEEAADLDELERSISMQMITMMQHKSLRLAWRGTNG